MLFRSEGGRRKKTRAADRGLPVDLADGSSRAPPQIGGDGRVGDETAAGFGHELEEEEKGDWGRREGSQLDRVSLPTHMTSAQSNALSPRRTDEPTRPHAHTRLDDDAGPEKTGPSDQWLCPLVK